VKSGYPPKPLVYTDPTQLISSLNLSRNEQVVVSASTSSSSTSAASKEPPVRSGSGRVEGLFGSSTAGAAGGAGASSSSAAPSSNSKPSPSTTASNPPSRPSSAAPGSGSKTEGDWVKIEAGYLVLKIVPSVLSEQRSTEERRNEKLTRRAELLSF